MSITKIFSNIIPPDKARKAITTLGKDGTLLPVVLLETTVTGGRTLQAYKRDGYTEARERFCEETVGAVFWLFGVKMFNKLGDSIGKHFLKIPETNFDVGKDALRTPFNNITSNLAKKGAQAKDGVKTISKEALAGFKFGKIILSVLAATSFIGFVVPKINQSITRKVISRDKYRNDNTQGVAKSFGNHAGSIDDFKNKVTSKNPSFKGGMLNADLITTIAHDLENHPIYKLLATDSGILTGRTINARNNDERVEVLFRDGASIYFYLFCTKNIINFMEKSSKFGNIAKLDPTTAKQTHEMLAAQIEKAGGKMTVDDFKKFVVGSISDEQKVLIEKLDFNKDGVISLKSLIKDLPKDKDLYKRAADISKLQPIQAGVGRVLTKQQVEDVLKEGSISSPEFLTKVYKESFGNDLTNPYKYIPMKRIQNFRKHIDDYVNTIAEYATSKGKDVDLDMLKTMNKSNLMKYGGFFGIGFLISAAFLSTIIPKTQYLITKIRTGKDQFPGLEDDGERKKLKSK